MDAEALCVALAGAGTVVCALGLPYVGKIWAVGWPRAMRAILRACEEAGARLVYADNLYLYGPQDRPLTEALPPVEYGIKPAAKCAATRLWEKAYRDGRVQTAAVRAPDFFGQSVTNSILGSSTFGRLALGKSAQVLFSADQPHDMVHITDFARALVTLVEAPDRDYGQAWHVPTPPTKTLREALTIAANAIGVLPRVQVLPGWAARPLGSFVPNIRELVELSFLFDRPYFVDASKFSQRFWSDVAPLEDSIPETARSYLTAV